VRVSCAPVRVRAACVLVLLTKKFWAPGSVRALESLDVARYEPRTVPRYSGY
jgi:hypothetical protein